MVIWWNLVTSTVFILAAHVWNALAVYYDFSLAFPLKIFKLTRMLSCPETWKHNLFLERIKGIPSLWLRYSVYFWNEFPPQAVQFSYTIYVYDRHINWMCVKLDFIILRCYWLMQNEFIRLAWIPGNKWSGIDCILYQWMWNGPEISRRYKQLLGKSLLAHLASLWKNFVMLWYLSWLLF